MKRLLVVLLLAAIVAGFCSAAFTQEPGQVSADDPIITFPDPGLEAAIRTAINKSTGDIYQSDLDGLTRLDAGFRNISDLTGIEHCINLERLVLLVTQITDFSPLAGLSNLTILDADWGMISNIQPLSGLTNLQIIGLMDNKIIDIQPLSGLTSLTQLNLAQNQVSDIQPLVNNSGIDSEDYVNLTENPLSYTSINNYIPALQARGVTVEYIPQSPIIFPDQGLEAAIRDAIPKPSGDIYQSDLDGLTELSAGSRGIVELTGIEHCASLTYLDIEGNQIINISALSELTGLQYLCLGINLISDISALSELTNLQTLHIWDNQIEDITPLARMTDLTTVSLSSNQISNIQPLSGLTSLTYLQLWGNQISNIQPLSGLTSLTDLDLCRNQISDIQPLVNNSGIDSGDYVDLTENPLSYNSINNYIPALQARGVNVNYDATPTPTPTPTPTVTPTPTPIPASEWIYQSTYSEQPISYWKYTWLLQETLPSGNGSEQTYGGLCNKYEIRIYSDAACTIPTEPTRSYTAVNIILKSPAYDWRHTDKLVSMQQYYRVFALGGNITNWVYYRLFNNSTFGAPWTLGETWTYTEQLHCDWHELSITTNNIATIASATEEVTVPAGTFTCYNLSIMQSNKSINEYWDSNGVFTDAPVKIVDNVNFTKTQTNALYSFSALPPTPIPNPSVTLNIYVRNGSESGQVIPYAQISGYDASGSYFSKTTNADGYVTITGIPGTWDISVSKAGYQTNSSSLDVSTSCTKNISLSKRPLTGHAPVVMSVEAQFDGDSRSDTIGTFISGCAIDNLITAYVSDPDGNDTIDRVVFNLGGAEASGTKSGDGWQATFNMGDLSEDTILLVTAYDNTGLSDEAAQQVRVIPWPDWLKASYGIEGGIGDWSWELSFIADEAAFEFTGTFSPGKSWSFYVTKDGCPALNGLHKINPPEFSVSIKCYLSGKTEVTGDIGFSGQMWGRLIKIDNRVISTDWTLDAGVTGELTAYLELVKITGFLLADIEFEFPTPWNFSVPFIGKQGVVPWVRMHMSLNADFVPADPLKFDRADGSVGVELGVRVKVGDENLKIVPAYAEIYLSGDGTIAMIYEPSETDPLILDCDESGITVSAGYKVKIGLRWWGLSEEYNDEILLWDWHPCEGEAALTSTLAQNEQMLFSKVDSHYESWVLDAPVILLGETPGNTVFSDDLPDDFPIVASDGKGNAVCVWTHALQLEPVITDLYCSFWNGSGWSQAQPITNDANAELNPYVAYFDGNPMVIWTGDAGNMGEADYETWASGLEIYYSAWNGSAWSEPCNITDNTVADGIPSLASEAATSIAAWVSDMDGNISTTDDLELYSSIWNGSAWAMPLRLTDDALADAGPSVATSENTSVITWVRDVDANSSTQEDREIYYMTKNSSLPQTLTSDSLEDSEPFVTSDGESNFAAVWIKTEVINESDLDAVYFSSFNGLGWNTPQRISGFQADVTEPSMSFDPQGNILVAWSGYGNGSGDIEYCVREASTLNWSLPRKITNDDMADWQLSIADLDGRTMFTWLKHHSELVTDNGSITIQTDDDDVYYLLHTIAPDLAVNTSDISFSNSKPAPGETITIEAIARNAGDLTSGATLARFYDGDPDSGGTQIGGDVVIESLAPDGNTTVSIDWTALAGEHAIYVVVDTDNIIDEIDEANNKACNAVKSLPDLTLESEDITFSSTMPPAGADINIIAWIHNIGGLAADNVSVRFFDGDPAVNGSQIGSDQYITAIAAGDVQAALVQWAVSPGSHNIYVTVDPGDTIAELTETNNSASAIIDILPDLSITADDITFSATYPASGQDVTINATIESIGGESAANTTVHIYDGNPLLGGILIANASTGPLSPGGSVIVSTIWASDLGDHDIYVIIDPDDSLSEYSKSNNLAGATISVFELGDLTGDSHVNVLDMIRIGQHWGQTGAPGWIYEDVKPDGVINILDMILIGQHWTG